MNVRRKPQVVVILRSQGLQQSRRGILSQPFGHEALRAVYFVGLLAKGITFTASAFLYPIPYSRMRGHVGLNQRLPEFNR